ncbi:MAG: 50S ribosomal protein L9 [Chloroflexota bacterium]
MKILFLEDVAGQGKQGEVKDVSDGYGRNFLIPRGLAVPAASGAINLLTHRRKASDSGLAPEAIDGRELHFAARVGSKGKLHGAVTATHIAQELEKACGVPIDKRRIVLEAPLKEVGTFDVAVKLGRDKEAKIKVVVEEAAAK